MAKEHSAAEVFFKKVVVEYVRGDLKWLLEKKTPTLGPLAACIGAGIDTAGGCIFGFGIPSSKRSVDFMQQYMGIEPEIAAMIYACVRCGYVHEGLSKLNVSWFADYRRLQEGVCIYRRDDDGVVVNLVEVAHAYMVAIEQVWREHRSNIAHCPIVKAEDQKKVGALGRALPSLSDILNKYGDFLENTHGSHSMRDVFEGIRFWSKDGYARRYCR